LRNLKSSATKEYQRKLQTLKPAGRRLKLMQEALSRIKAILLLFLQKEVPEQANKLRYSESTF
jgi:hypothetical protein